MYLAGMKTKKDNMLRSESFTMRMRTVMKRGLEAVAMVENTSTSAMAQQFIEAGILSYIRENPDAPKKIAKKWEAAVGGL